MEEYEKLQREIDELKRENMVAGGETGSKTTKGGRTA
jgi:hypothetical protein